MKYLVIFITILSQSISALAACGDVISGYTVRDKTVAVHLSSGKDKRYAMDDDGYLVISLAIAHCRAKHPSATPKLTKPQADCVGKYPAPDNLNFFSYDSSEHTKTAGMNFYKTQCSVNYHEAWKQVLEERKSQKLTCADEVREIVNKAVAQNRIYVANQTSDERINKLPANEKEKIPYVGGLIYDRAQLAKLESIVNDSKAMVADLDAWISDLEGPVNRHGYQIASNDELRPVEYLSLADILRSVNADFPFLRPKKDAKVETCAKLFYSQSIANLKGISWANAQADAKHVAPAASENTK